MADYFGPAAELGYKSGSSMGNALEGIGQSLVAKKQQETAMHQQLAGQMLGEFIKQGRITPDKNFTAMLAKQFGMAGYNISEPKTVADITKSIGADFAVKGIKTDPQGQVTDVEWKSPDEIKKDQQDMEIKQNEIQVKQQEEQRKLEEKKASDVKQAGQGLPWFGLVDSPQKREYEKIQEDFRKQLLSKSNPPPKYDSKTQKLQYNSKTGEYRVLDK